MAANLWNLFEGQWVDGKYHLVQLIGVGGFGAVFLADHVIGDRHLRRVAVKLIPIEDGDRDRQLAEISIAVSLRHPCLLESYDAGTCAVQGVSMLYLVMEVADESLDKRTGGRISAEDTRKIMVDVAEGLAYLHGLPERYVHRDVKPSNILRVGASWKLSDFGITRGVGRQTHLQTAHLLGTPAYASPETYDGVVSPAQDVWALGVVMSEMLTGSHPFPSGTPQQLMKLVLGSEPQFPSPLPPPFDSLAPACLRKERNERITAVNIVRELSLCESQESIPPASPQARTQPTQNCKIVNGLEFVRVPAGEFLYGDKKVRTFLNEFWIMRNLVTVRQYRQFREATNRKMPDAPYWGWIDDHPVVNVTWHDAAAFAQWAGCQLPTEREWEKAARGTDGREYPWGDKFDASKCIFSVGHRRDSTAPVGSLPSGASPYGCLDMAGNAWEWCEDWYYKSHDGRVLRGGSFRTSSARRIATDSIPMIPSLTEGFVSCFRAPFSLCTLTLLPFALRARSAPEIFSLSYGRRNPRMN